MPEIITAKVDKIAINPFRRLHDYPYVQSKLDALERSIDEVGLWPSIIARSGGGHKYEIAFGHHRLEAAKRRKLKEVPLIVEQLSDRQMLQYMGRENLEDYNANFLIQLESWEAAMKSGLFPACAGKTPDAIDIARLLGWTELREDNQQLNATARACQAAYGLIQGGYSSRDDFEGQTVRGARDIAETGWMRVQQLNKFAATHKTCATETEKEKQRLGKAITTTATQVREGRVKSREIRGTLAFNYMSNPGNRPSPLFEAFANEIAKNLQRTLNTDADSVKLAGIEKVLEQITLIEDAAALRRLDVELVNLGERANGWRKRLTPTKEKVVQLRALEDGRASK